MALRRKALVWSLAVAVLGGVCLWLITEHGDKTAAPKMDLSFVGYTNRNGAKLAVFKVANRNSHTVRYEHAVEEKTSSGWPVYRGLSPLAWISGDASPHQDFVIEAKVPTRPGAWRVIVTWYVLDTTRFEEARAEVAQWFWDRHYNTVGEIFHTSKGGGILGPEMTEE